MEAEKGKNEVSKFGMSYLFEDTIQVNVAVVSCSFPIRPSHLILQGFPALSLMAVLGSGFVSRGRVARAGEVPGENK